MQPSGCVYCRRSTPTSQPYQAPQLSSPSLKSIAMGILRGWPLGASIRLEEEGGARWLAGDCAFGVAAPLPALASLGWLVSAREEAEVEEARAREEAPLPEGVLAREALEEGSWVADGACARLAARGIWAELTWMCTGAPRAWPGLLGEAGGGVWEGTDTM